MMARFKCYLDHHPIIKTKNLVPLWQNFLDPCMKVLSVLSCFVIKLMRKRGSVVECLARDRKTVGSSITSGTALCH